MTTRAQAIVDATMELTLRPQQGDRARVIAAAIRETINQLQYDIADWQSPNEHMVIDVKDILILANELEKL